MIRSLVVQLVTPAILGGAEQRGCDMPPNLRPPSLRGQLRFWSRVLGGEDLSTWLWGNDNVGQRVRILQARPLRGSSLGDSREYPLLPHKNGGKRAVMPMIPAGDRVHIRFAIPERDETILAKLQAVVWIWLLLGGVGKRSRRGYGSLLWIPSSGDLLSDFGPGVPLWSSHHLISKKKLEDYLRQGFEVVQATLDQPRAANRTVTSVQSPELRSLDQIHVGFVTGEWKEDPMTEDEGTQSLQYKIHGRHVDFRGKSPGSHQLGSGTPGRVPSPILWRLFPLGGRVGEEDHLVVMTWFPIDPGGEYPPGTRPTLAPTPGEKGGILEYLSGTLNLESSLAGQPLS